MIPSGSAYCPSKSGFVHPVHSVVFGAQAGATIKEIAANNRIVLNFIQLLLTIVADTAVGISHYMLLISVSFSSQSRYLFFLRLLVSGRVVSPFKRVENCLYLSEILALVIFRGIDEAVQDNDILTVTAIEGM